MTQEDNENNEAKKIKLTSTDERSAVKQIISGFLLGFRLLGAIFYIAGLLLGCYDILLAANRGVVFIYYYSALMAFGTVVYMASDISLNLNEEEKNDNII